MAFKINGKSPNISTFNYPAKNSQQYRNGELLVRDTANAYVIPAVAATAEANVIECIVYQATGTTAASGTVTVTAIPLSSDMLIEADCTNNTAANQLMKAHLLTDSLTVNNTSTTSTDKDATFIALAVKGAASDKKLIGRIVRLGQALS